MDGSYEHIVIGGGLAGVVSAYHLAPRGRTLLLEKNKIGSGASGALSGLVNPFMSRKANPVWEWKQALEAFETLLSSASVSACFRKTGVLRPAAAFPQKLIFRDVSRAFPEEASWLQPQAVRERWPSVPAANGALYVLRGGSLEMERYVRGIANAAEKRGCEVQTGTTVLGMKPDAGSIAVKTDSGTVLGGKVILCVGGDYVAWPQLSELRLHAIKGQLVETKVPDDLIGDIPSLSGGGYITRHKNRLVLGSTFRHTFTDLSPTQEDTEEVIRKTAPLLPSVRVAPVTKTWVGVRVTVPGTRLPIVGPIDATGKLWIFSGLGAKGVLMSAVIGRNMPGYLANPDTIPPELRPN